jgi:hypothetical protein
MFDNNHFNYDGTSAKPYFCHNVQVFGGFSYWSQGVSWRNLWVFEVFGGLIDLYVGFPSPWWFFILIVQIYPSKVCGVFGSLVGS